MSHYCRTIRFQDTDAAGVVYFAQVLSLCHEAYEASLQQFGIDVSTFFSRGAIAVPITHAEADFRRPLMCGDIVNIQLTPRSMSPHSFQIEYEVSLASGKVAAIAQTHHICIDTTTRQRCLLMPELTQWLQQWPASVAVPIAANQPD
ncbi:MAG: acyl-CoA thioesterase [Leptolyngbya sp. SIO1D8]|nr:acyl-CoA thioesterase [Leptolyngbya sp. SIO1D8]